MALPERDGISPSRVYLPPGQWGSLLDFFIERFPRVAPDVLRQRLEMGKIMDENGVAQHPDAPYFGNRWLWYYRDVPDEIPVPFEIPVLYRDARLVVADKPHFMATTPGGRYLRHTALIRLRKALDLPLLSPIHRLDRETAGVLMFCADPAYRGHYQRLFQDREVLKEYEAVAVPPPNLEFPYVHRSRLEVASDSFLMLEVPGEANSETRIELLQQMDSSSAAWFRLLPLTGRKHQLRAHMNGLGMPILNDTYYPVLRPESETFNFDRPLQLLARALEFRDPVDGRMRRFESERMLDCVTPLLGLGDGAALRAGT